MVDTVMTMARTHVRTIIRGDASAPIGGDFRDIKFRCRFSANAVNGGTFPAPKPEILVRIQTEAPEYLYRVEILPPNGQPERLRRLSAGPIPWARRIEYGAGGPRVASRSATRRAIGESDWELDDPFGDLDDVFEPVPPGGGWGGGGGKTYTRILDPAIDQIGMWSVRVEYSGQDEEEFSITVNHPETVQVLHKTRIPFQLINRVFSQALLSMQLRIHIDNGQARIEFDPTFRALTGVENQILSVTDRLQDINLQEFTLEILNEDGVPTIRAGLDLEDRGREIGAPGPDINVDDLAIICRVQLTFAYPLGPDFFETAMTRQDGQIVKKSIGVYAYLDANPELSGFWASFANVILSATGQLGLTSGSSLDDYVQDAIDDAEGKLGRALRKAAPYFQDVIMHLVDRDAVMFRLTADDDGIIVTHHRRPGIRDFLDELPADEGQIVQGDLAMAQPENTRPDSAPHAALEMRRALPTKDARSRTAAHLREGEIDHIVILMMENRSFDHMLGYRHFARTDVNGLTGGESNQWSQGAPYAVHHLASTSGIRGPAHGFEATLEQIANGSMTGFVENYSKRSGVVDPGLVMGYYDATDLPMYEFLANNFAICDNWHSSHPGETQCNRFAALTGTIPELTNLDLADPRLGYYQGNTIFDFLSRWRVEWAYAEGNIAFLRMFNKYRIDVAHVIPYFDDFDQGIEDTFVGRVRRGALPPVSFIDPRYIDVPPAWDANDDLAPADVCRGQQLLSHVYSLLSSQPTWSRTLLLVTYDEHGGFYDHETPLGMVGSRDPTPFPRLHPDGPPHLGVRVPAFVVTPWIDGGTVLHTPFDHTSILKTILQRFAPADYPIEAAFGPRTAAANGVLSEQLRSSARQQVPQAPIIECRRLGQTGPSAQLDSDDFHTSMRLLGLPAKYRELAAG